MEDIMPGKIFITGSTGIIGREIIEHAAKADLQIRLGLRDLRVFETLKKPNMTAVEFDYRKDETFYHALEDIQTLIMLLPLMNPRLDEMVDPFLDSAREFGVNHIICVGGIGISQETGSPIMITEKCVENLGLRYNIIHPNLLMQNFGSVAVQSIRSSNRLMLPGGDARVSFVDARDIGEAIIKIALSKDRSSRVYSFTGKEALDHFDIAYILSKVTGRTITYIPLSHNCAVSQLVKNGWDEEPAKKIVSLYEIARQGWCSEVRPELAMLLERDPIDFEQYAYDNRDLW